MAGEWLRSNPDLAKKVSKGEPFYRVSNTELWQMYNRQRPTPFSTTHLYRLLKKRGIPLHKPQRPRDLSSIRELSSQEKAWLACALDSEGSIYCPKGRQIALQIVNTNRQFVENARLISGVGLISSEDRSKLGRQTMYKWKLGQKDASQRLLKLLLPFLIVKKDRAELALKW